MKLKKLLSVVTSISLLGSLNLTSCNTTKDSSTPVEINYPTDDLSKLEFTQEGELLKSKLKLETSLNLKELKVTVKDHYNNKYVTERTFSTVQELNNYEFSVKSHGSYTVKIVHTDVNNTTKQIVKEVTYKAKQINFAYIVATMPISYFTYLSLYNEAPTYFLLERSATYDYENLPENFYFIPYVSDGDFKIKNGSTIESYDPRQGTPIEKDGKSFGFSIFESCDSIVKRMYDDLDQDLFVNFYFTDLHHPEVFDMGQSFLPPKNHHNYLLSDGTATQGKDLYGSVKDMDKLEKTIQNINKELEKGMDANDLLAASKEDKSYFVAALPATKSPKQKESNYSLTIPDRQNILLANPILMEDKNLRKYVELMTRELSFSYMKEKLEKEKPEQYEKFQLLLNLKDKDGTSPLDIFDKNAKPNLLILGTRAYAEEIEGVSFNEMMDLTIKEFGDEYEIFYKGHPAEALTPEREKYFQENNIVNYTNTSTPAEFLILFGNDMYVGGYNTSTFYSVPAGRFLISYNTEKGLTDAFPIATKHPNLIYAVDQLK